MRKRICHAEWKQLTAAILMAMGMSGVGLAPVMAANYTEGLTGIVAEDRDIIGDDGNTVKENKSTNTITYDFKGKDHTFTVRNQDGIGTNTDRNSYNYVFNNVDKNGNKGTLHIYQTNNHINDFVGVTGFSASNGQVTVNSNLDITAYSAYASVGISAANDANLVINGNVTMKKADANNPWGIITKNVHGNYGPGGAASAEGSENYTGARWQPSAFSTGYTYGNITVNGNVDVAVRGTAVKTDAYSGKKGVNPYDLSTISLIGDSIRIITPDNERNTNGMYKEGYYSLASYGGTVNVNVKDMKATGGKTELVGNVIALKRSNRTTHGDTYQNGRVNIGLTTADSSWHGVIDNAGKDHAGEVNVWLSNGAQWIHETTSRTDGLDYGAMPSYSKPDYDYFDGVSYVNRFTGGNSEESTGFITMKNGGYYHNAKEDKTRNIGLHIQNYSGYSTVIYQHTGDGTKKDNYLGGDFTITHAESGSNITLATGMNGIDTSDKAAVSKVLNALASKLIYEGYAKIGVDRQESNLRGTVVIASGLTASSFKADISGLIRFDKTTGVGGYQAPKEGEQQNDQIKSGISGTMSDTEYLKNNIRQDDGTYKFTMNPSSIVVKDGHAIDALSDVTIQAQDVTLSLEAEDGIHTNGKAVVIDAKELHIGTSNKNVENGIVANGGNVKSEGITNITATKDAIYAQNGGKVTVGNGDIVGKITSDNSEVTINKSAKESSVKGNLQVSHKGTIDLTVTGSDKYFKGDIVGEDTTISTFDADPYPDGTINLAVVDQAEWTGGHKNANAELNLTLNGGSWYNTSDEATTVQTLSGGDKKIKTIQYKDPEDNTDKSIGVNGFIRMGDNAGDVTINHYSGTHIISYAHENSGSDVKDYKGGNTHIRNAAEHAMVIAATDSKGIRLSDETAVENTMKALAQKFFYDAGDDHLTGKTLIASGLTSSSLSRFIGDMTFDESHQGKYKEGSLINIAGDFETAIMKGARAAITSSLMSWRTNADDLIYRGDLLRQHMEEEGLWARTYGGKDSYDATGVDISNQYWGVQIGYDKVYPAGVIAGAAIDYQTGNSNYSYMDDDFGAVYGNTGKSKVYSLGLYGSKDLGNKDHFDLTVKAGSVGNDYTVYNGIGNELKGSYRNRAYSISSRYGKKFGDQKKYVEPQLQFTWAHVSANDYTAHSGDEELQVGQGSFDSVVGRVGLEAGKVGKSGTLYGKLSLAHEFNGAIRGTYYSDDGGEKNTNVSMKDTWLEATLGTTLQLGETGTAYLDVSRTFGGDYQQDWKVNGGVRFAVGSGVIPGAKRAALQKSVEEAKVIIDEAQKTGKNTAASEKSVIPKTEPIQNVNVVTQTPTTTKMMTETHTYTTAAPVQADVSYDNADVTYAAPAVSYENAGNGTPVYTLGPVVVTANRIPQPILEAKADMSVVSRKEIETMHMESLEDTLRTIPGVQFQNYGSNGLNANVSSVRINGSKDIVILIDGVRVNDFKGANSSGYMFAALLNNMDNIERVEVLRGASSVMYGSGAKGGVINIITRKPTTNEATMDISRGSFGKENYKFNVMGAKGKVRYNAYHDANILSDTKDGSGRVWPGHSNTKSSGMKFQYDLNKDQNVSVSYDKVDSDFTGTDLIYKGHYIGSFDNENLTLKHDWTLSKLWNNTFVYRNTKEKYLWSKPGGEDPTMDEPITGDTEYTLFSDTFKYTAKTYTMVGGVEWNKGKDRINHKEVKNTSLFLQNDWEFIPHVTLSAGVRHDSPKDFDSHNSFSYKLGWDFTKKDTVYAGYSDFYVLPSISQLYDVRFGNKDIKASEGHTNTIGYNHEFSPDHYIMFNWFDTKTDVDTGMMDDGTYTNTYNQKTRGWNVQYNVPLSEHLTAKLGWAYLHNDPSNDTFTYKGYAPKHKATFGIYYDKDKVSAALDGFYFIRGKKENNDLQGWPCDKYAVFNLAFNYRANKETEFYFKVDNLFNKLWAEHTDVIWNPEQGPDRWYAMPGRSLTVGMKLRF